MSKKGKLCLALFLALAVIVQYSFAPQTFIAYADDEVTAASVEEPADNDQTPKKEEAEKPAPAQEAAPAAEQSQEAASSAEQPKDVEQAKPVEKKVEGDQAEKIELDQEEVVVQDLVQEKAKPKKGVIHISVTGHTATVDFDGQSHTVSGYDFTATIEWSDGTSTPITGSDLNKIHVHYTGQGHEPSVTASEKGLHEMGLTAGNFHVTQPTSLYGYNFNKKDHQITNVTDGWLLIQDKPAQKVTWWIQYFDNSATYDGEYHECSCNHGGSTAFCNSADYKTYIEPLINQYRPTGTNVGKYAGELTPEILAAAWKASGNTDFDVTFEVRNPGTLIINPKPVTIIVTAPWGQREYTGKEIDVPVNNLPQDNVGSGWKYETEDTLLKKMGYSPAYIPKDHVHTADGGYPVNVGKYPTAVSDKAGDYTLGLGRDENDFDLNQNFAPKYVVTQGYLEITQAVITITVHDAKKVYKDADPEFSATVEGPVKVAYSLSREPGENVGEYTITASVGKPETHVKPIEWDYAQEIAVSEKIPMAAKSTAKEAKKDYAAEKIDVETKPVNYRVVVIDGTLTITPKEINVKVEGNKESRVYNGKEQTLGGLNVTSELPKGVDVVWNHMTMYAAHGTNVGPYYTNIVASKLAITEDGEITKNYAPTFDITQGVLTITPATLTIKADNKSMNITDILNGATPEFTATVTGLCEGDEVPAYTVSCTYENAPGTYPIHVDVKQGLPVKPQPIFKEVEAVKEVAEYMAVETVKLPAEVQAKALEKVSVEKKYELVDYLVEQIKPQPIEVKPISIIDVIGTEKEVSNYDINVVDGTFAIGSAAVTPAAGGPAGGGAAVAAAAAAAAAAAPAAAAAAPATTIDQAPTPTTINDNPAPKAAAGSWALINLICALLTALLSLIMLIRYFGKRREEDEVTGEVNEVKSGGGVRLASIIPAIGAIIAFIVTENMANPMVMVDKWTVMMIVILAIQAGVGVLAKIRDDYEIEDAE